MDYTTLTLGQLLTHTNETIKRNAMSILKTLQKMGYYRLTSCMECKQRIELYTGSPTTPIRCPDCGTLQ